MNSDHKWISVDVETDGQIPGDYSMICFGAVLVEEGLSNTFEGQCKPISDNWNPHALAVSGFSRGETMQFPDAADTITKFSIWLQQFRQNRLMFISDNNGFDWSFMNWYLWHFNNEIPLGIPLQI